MEAESFQGEILEAGGVVDRRDTFVGTINYMSPETIDKSISVMETDLWALGCVIFKMATGRVPFPGM